jgi:hypothetical protein
MDGYDRYGVGDEGRWSSFAMLIDCYGSYQREMYC